MTKIEELLETIERYQYTPEPIDTYGYFDIIKIMKEYADWYAAENMKYLFSHAESFHGKQILDLNKVKNLTTLDHD